MAVMVLGLGGPVAKGLLEPELIYLSQDPYLSDFSFETDQDQVLMVIAHLGTEGGGAARVDYTITDRADDDVEANSTMVVDEDRGTFGEGLAENVRYKYEFIDLDGSGRYNVSLEGGDDSPGGDFTVQLMEVYVDYALWELLFALGVVLLVVTVVLAVATYRWRTDYDAFRRPFMVLVGAVLAMIIFLIF